MTHTDTEHRGLWETERALLHHLRTLRRRDRSLKPEEIGDRLTSGQRIADQVAATMGSWSFIIIPMQHLQVCANLILPCI